MRKWIFSMAIIAILITSMIYLGVFNKASSSENQAVEFIEHLFTATPETYDLIYSNDGYDIGPYTEKNIQGLVTEELLIGLYANRLIAISSNVARNYNANITVDALKLTNMQVNEEKIHYNFDGVIKVRIIDTGEVADYPFSGQIALLKEKDGFKIFVFKLFSLNLKDLTI